jgi:hypothetical protein
MLGNKVVCSRNGFIVCRIDEMKISNAVFNSETYYQIYRHLSSGVESDGPYYAFTAHTVYKEVMTMETYRRL